MTDALQIRGLCKSFAKPAVDQLDLTIPSGCFYALLGPNGAGKTTTLRMVSGLLQPDAGSVMVFGVDVVKDPPAAKRMMALVPDEPALYENLSAAEYLEFTAGLWQVPQAEALHRAEDLLKLLDLWDVRHQRCSGFSRGMKQKTVLAGALIHDPKLLILDEPLTGLDAASARVVKNLLLSKLSSGVTVIFTTHILEVAERMAQKIGIIQKGKLLAEGTLEELRAREGMAGSTLEDVFLELTGSVAEAAQ